MNKHVQSSYKQSHEIAEQQTFLNQQSQQPTFCSPFRKHLPVIFQTECSPHKQFIPQKMDYLQSRYESRLIAVDESLWGSGVEGSMPNDSRLLNQRERQLLAKIYEKEKDLVMLEEKLYLLKNSNECLRETIREDNMEKRQLNEQVQKLRQQSTKMQQEISQLNNKINELQQKSHSNNQQQNQEQTFFDSHNFQSKSIQQLSSQNHILKKQVQQLKAFYEQEFYRMLERHEKSINYLEEKLRHTQQEKSSYATKTQQLSQKLLDLNTQKREMLEYYLKVIEEMKRQIASLKAHPNTVSQKLIQESILQDKSDYCPENNYSTVMNENNASFDHNNSKSIDIGRLLHLQAENNILMQMVGKTFRNDHSKEKSRSKSRNNNNSKSIKKSGSSSSLNVFNKNMESNSKLNMTYLAYKYTDRVLPTSRRNKLSPAKNNQSSFIPQSTASIKVPIASFLSKQSYTPRLASTYTQKHQEIDKKLQLLKEKLTREITY